MNLVDIQSAAENEFIRQLAKDEFSAPLIGLFQRFNGQWPWQAGFMQEYNRDGTNGTWMWQAGGTLNYQNWAPEEPSARTVHACMNSRDGLWYSGCGRSHVLCKK